MVDLVVNREEDDTISLSSFEGSDDIQVKKPTKPRPQAFSKPRGVQFKKQSLPQQPPRQKPPPPPELNDDTFQSFSNPQKTYQNVPQDHGEEERNDDDDQSVVSSAPGDDENERHNEYADVVHPSPGYASIEEEKQDLLYQFSRIEEKGFKLSKKYSINSDVLEMRAELHRIKRASELKGTLKFSRRALMACVSGMEFINKTYDPCSLELEGWSENVMENLNDGDYDNVFERLHDKYAGKVNTPPEMELMIGLAGSALMFHITSSMFKNMPSGAGDMRNIVKNMSMPKPEQTPEDAKKPPGPNMDFGSMFNAFQPPPQPTRFQEEDQAASPQMSDDSDDARSSNASERNINIAQSEGTAARRRGRKSKIVMSKENTIHI